VSRELDLVFLGCGRAAATHARLLGSLDEGVRLHFASRDPTRSQAARKRHGGAGAFPSYEAALADEAVDVVFVTTPPTLHLDLTLAALEAGKDVIVEKPAFPAPEDFGQVRRAMERSPGRVLVAENYYYKPLRRRLEDILARGLVGEPLFLHVNAVKRQRPEGWRGARDLVGGGGLLEGGIHWINLVSNLGLDVVDVSGHRAGGGTGEDRAGEDVAESILAVLSLEGGSVATLAFSWEVPSPLRGIRMSRIYGREGSVLFESNGLFVCVQGRRTRFYLPGFRDLAGYRAMLTDFLHALRTAEEPAMTLSMAERDVEIAHRIYRSLES
jgi:predicted dehydrogenase